MRSLTNMVFYHISETLFLLRQITKDLLESLPKVRVIANVSAGYNHIDTDLCKSVNVKVTNTPAVLDDSCADMAMLLLMSAARNLHQGKRK